MEVKRNKGKISTKDSLSISASSDDGVCFYSTIEASYENIESIFNDMRRKLPKDYPYKMFRVNVVCEAKEMDNHYRVSIKKPPVRRK
jgi:hypothetical protein